MLGNFDTTRYPTAQAVRSALIDNGFIPLVKIGPNEHFVREGRRIIVAYDGDYPDKAHCQQLAYATIVHGIVIPD